MPPINQKNSYSSWQPVAYVLAVGRESNDAKSGLGITFPRMERGKWLSKLFLVLCTIAQYLLTLIHHKFLFTNKGSRQLTYSLFWVSSGQYQPIGVNSYITQKHGETELWNNNYPVLLSHVPLKRDRQGEHRVGSSRIIL